MARLCFENPEYTADFFTLTVMCYEGGAESWNIERLLQYFWSTPFQCNGLCFEIGGTILRDHSWQAKPLYNLFR